MANATKLPSSIGFKPTAEDIDKIKAIKDHFVLPDSMRTSQILKMAVEVWYRQLEDDKKDA